MAQGHSVTAERGRSSISAGTMIVLLSGNVLTALIFTALSPVLPEIADHYGGELLAQMIMSTPGMGIIVGGLVGGLAVNFLGARGVLLAGLALFAITGSAPIYLESSTWVLVSRFLLGASAAIVQTAFVTLISVAFDEARRARLIGYAAAIGYSSAILAVLISGVAAEWGGWRAPVALYLVALPILVMAVIFIRPELETSGSARPPRTAADRAALLRLWPTYLLIPFFYAANYMLAIQFSFLLQANGVVSPAEKSLIMVASSVLAVVGAASSGRIREAIGASRLFGLMALLLGSGYVVIGSADSHLMVVIGAAIAGLGGGMVLPTLVNLVIGQAPLALRSTAIGLVYSAAYVGEFLNPVLLDPVRHAVGIHGVFTHIGGLLAAVGLATILVTLIGGKSQAKRQGESNHDQEGPEAA